MSRRSFFLTSAVLLIAGSGIGGCLYGLIRYERSWYAQSAAPSGDLRSRHSQEFYSEFCEFISAVSSEREWWGNFTQDQINSYFVEGFVQSGLNQRILPENISDPRLSIEADALRFGFRYGTGPWSTIITIDLRVWLPAGEPNVMALELVGLYAGVVPIKAQSILERIAQAARDNGIEVNWYRLKNHPVALLRFQADQPRATMQLQAVALSAGAIMIRGCSPETTPSRASLPPTVPGLKINAN